MKLYQLVDLALRLDHAVHNAESPEEKAVAMAAFDQGMQDVGAKLDNCAKLIATWQAECAAMREEEQRLADRRRSLEREIDSLCAYVGRCLGAGNRYKTNLFTFGWRKSEAVELDCVDVRMLPELYQRTRIEADREAIKRDLKAGASVPYARLVERQNLQIK